jgi:hypothetical protein
LKPTPAVQSAHVQLTILVPLMVAAPLTGDALRMGHAVPMALETVCVSVRLVVGDSNQDEAC